LPPRWVARPPVLFSTSRPPGSTSGAASSSWDAIEALVSEGTTVLLTTQYLDEAIGSPIASP
jgi:ABC-2 type transport system ATP-binding protein